MMYLHDEQVTGSPPCMMYLHDEQVTGRPPCMMYLHDERETGHPDRMAYHMASRRQALNRVTVNGSSMDSE